VKVVCPYCKRAARLVTGDALYRNRPDLAGLFFWLCAPCDAYVGTHNNSPDHKPLGRLANAELRDARKETHAFFDQLWRNGKMTRSAAYLWLAEQLNLPAKKCHIGDFDLPLCRKTIRLCKKAQQVSAEATQ